MFPSPFLSTKRGLFLFPKRGGETDGYGKRHVRRRYGHVEFETAHERLSTLLSSGLSPQRPPLADGLKRLYRPILRGEGKERS
jgi:hypothetical protein